jgi:hypothetical protein
MSKWVSLGIFLIAAAVTSIFFINFCATVFQCGCQSLWGEAAQFCNIHHARAHGGKGCPWCTFGNTGYAAVYGSMLAAQAGCAFLTRLDWPYRLAVTLAAFPLTGAILALVLGIMTGYWN